MGAPRSIVEKIWDAHRVTDLDAQRSLLFIDRVFLHERTGAAVFDGLAAAGRRAAHPELVFATTDHVVGTRWPRSDTTQGAFAMGFIGALRDAARQTGIHFIDLHDPRQGIVHVVSPEQGIALPGLTLVCPDSHTGTVGGIGALAWGIGSTEGEHAVATQTLVRPHVPQMRVNFEGRLPAGVTAKDMILALIARHGSTGGAVNGVGAAIEFAGEAVRALDVEGRMTICNMAVEFGAWTGIVAPDAKTIAWVRGRPQAPAGALFERAAAEWLALASDDDARWDHELTLDVSALAPQLTWGTTPAHGGDVNGSVPQDAPAAALAYMGLAPGQPLLGLPIDAAFIGSCTNSRLPDLRAAAALLRAQPGRPPPRVAPGVKAIVVPGSMPVRAAAEAEGLHQVFIDAGFEWRASGCSLCFFAGVDDFGTEKSNPRVVSSTNRNFEGRQGPGVRTHLASPLTVVASALAGHIADPRSFSLPLPGGGPGRG